MKGRWIAWALIAVAGVYAGWQGWLHWQERPPNITHQPKGFTMKEDFKTAWGVKDLPPEFEKLLDFQTFHSAPEEYAESFYIRADDRHESGLDSWSKEKSFLERLYPFARANGSGSIYAIWDDGSGRPLGQMPVVVFGDEGGEYVVAEDFVQFMRLLTYDVEIWVVLDGVEFYKDEDDYEHSRDHLIYEKWLKKEFDANPVSEPDEVVKPAQKKYGSSFEQWMKQYPAGE
jgi:hypothetical protein